MFKGASVYRRLPHPLREVAASAYGAYLKAWRYGRRTEQYIQDALERESWSADKWNAWTEERLAKILNRAATSVPYYREYWSRRRRNGDVSTWEVLDNWPRLSKQAVRDNPRAFVADDCDVRWMFREYTSGSTGTPLTLWWSRETVQRWYALFEARIRRWSGVSRRRPWAILGGRVVVPVEREVPPFWVWNRAMHQLYLSSYHLTPANAAYYVDALDRRDVTHVIAYPSAIYTLARMCLENNLNAPRIKAVITNAEPLYDYQRSAIAEAFGCAVRETYGMAEIVSTACECADGGMHLWPEVGIIETFERGRAEGVLEHGKIGSFVCTGLFNPDMPLVRYEVGDSGAILPPDATCSCGRSLPLLDRIEGRLDDIIVTPDGRFVGRLDPVFKSQLPIREAQVVQTSMHKLEVSIVPADGWNAEQAQFIIDAVRERVGDVEISLSLVSSIPRTESGKFRSVISHVEREALDGYASN